MVGHVPHASRARDDGAAPGEQGTSAVFAANRAHGRVSLAVAASSFGTGRTRTCEEGSLRVRFPAACAGAREAVLVNTAGGIAGGDRFAVDLALAAGARLTVTTASAEKVYRSLGPDACIDITADIAAGAELVWLPQETILFDRARLARTVEIAMAPDATLVFAEMAMFGRAAMDETVAQGHFSDRWRIRRRACRRPGGLAEAADRLVFAENFRLDGAIAECLRDATVANGRAALGTLLLVPGGNDEVMALRAAAAGCRGDMGVSTWNGLVLARFIAADGAALRHDLTRALGALGRAALPRLWLN